MELHSVTKVVHGGEPDMYILTCTITDMNGETYECEYVSREGDGFGLNPTIRQWLVDNPDFPRDPYVAPVPPTQEQLREVMPKLSARQFRLGLVAGGRTPSQVDAAIDLMTPGPEQDAARIEWEYATEFKRTHPLIDTLSVNLGLTPEQVDELWNNAINL